MSDELDLAIAAQQKQLEAIDAANAIDAKKRELELGALRLKCCSELGQEGRNFAIVDTVEGPVAVTRVAAIVSKRFRDQTAKRDATPQDFIEFTTPGVVSPDKDTYKKWCSDAEGIPIKVAGEILKLQGYLDEEKRAKR
jgi:hypothetical protein